MLQTEHFNRCIQTLDASFALLKRAKPGSVEYEVYRNATSRALSLSSKRGANSLESTSGNFRFARRGGQALLQGRAAPCRETRPAHAR